MRDAGENASGFSLTSSIWHSASGIQHPASGIWHLGASSISRRRGSTSTPFMRFSRDPICALEFQWRSCANPPSIRCASTCIGAWLIESIPAHPELQGLRRFMLLTRDAGGHEPSRVSRRT
jgi:hypothetical protein